MRTGLSTIQQTLTAEAAAVLNRSIAEASRRSHGQTTPLHVAATLLAAPSGLLRQACIRSHPNSSHPLQCRALELCFSVALDRLPSTNPTPSNTSNSNTSNSCSATADPPISNALLAALKRAQAHQRRGCPEQQQQPLLAVKVELEQLVVSILDDPSVSRVMREASFSSPAVKATIEQSLANITSTPTSSAINLPQRSISSNLYINPRLQQGSGAADPARKDDAQRGNLYINPRLQQGSGAVDTARKDDAQRVLDIMVRTKKRNPVIVTDSDPAKLMREVLERMEAGDAPAPLRGAHVISLEKEFTEISDRSRIPSQIKELGGLIEARIGDGSGRGVVLDAGDLKWLVENPAGSMGTGQIQQQQIVSEAGRAAVAEMTKVLQRFGDGGRVWLLGTATCPTYLRCQVYHPAMDNDWDLQALPIAPRSTVPSLLPRNSGINGILSSSVESLAPTKGFPSLCTTMSPLRRPVESTETSRKTTLCPVCMENYERELASLVAKEFEKSSSDSMPEARQALPHWLKPASNKSPAEPHQAQEVLWKQSTEELLKRWRDTCSRLHPTSNPLLAGREHRPALAFPVPSLHNPSTFPPRTTLQTRLTLSRSTDPASNHQSRLLHMSNQRPRTPPRSPVKTDLVLGHPKAFDSALEKAHRDRLKDSTGCKPDRLSDNRGDKAAGVSDMDSFKRLYKGLVEKVEWQPEAASAVATMVMQCKAGNGKSRGAGPKGDSWLLFIGSDKVGKRKMAASLSELVFGAVPVIVNIGSSSGTIGNYREEAPRLRGRTSLDQVSEAIRRNPFSVVVLEGIDSADMLVRESIKRAIDKGRLLDSQGREVSLGSVMFVLDSDWLPEELRRANDSLLQCEERILSSANCGWELELSVGDSSRKHGSECEYGDDRPTKLRKGLSGGPALSLDLNLAIGVSDDTGEGSRNSSDLTVEHEQESVRLAINCAAVSPASELIELVDCTIEFKPVDFSSMRRSVLESIYAKFSAVMGRGRLIQVDEDALDRIVGSVWLTGAPATDGFDEWADKALVPSIKQLYSNVTSSDGLATVRLSAVKSVQRRWTGSLPPAVAIAVDGLPRHDRYI